MSSVYASHVSRMASGSARRSRLCGWFGIRRRSSRLAYRDWCSADVITIKPRNHMRILEKNVFAQAAITFELGLGEELIEGTIKRKIFVDAMVIENVGRLISSQR